ncbi:virulence plasmid 28 protein [Pseudomonas fluorescens]|nr:virulence plasmid 28 protein [Pseudomonas fluorescens]
MKASQTSPVHQLVRAVLGQGKKRLSVPRKFDRYLSEFSSVFDLIKHSVSELQALGLTQAQAETMLARGRALALQITRLYRQQELRAAPRRGDKKAAVTLPTYEQLFTPNIDEAAPQGSPEHSASPVAYLVSLREFVRDEIEKHAGPDAIPLQERRPDVDQLMIDPAAINEVKSRVDIHSRILESVLSERLPHEYSTVQEFLGSTRVPLSMPFEMNAVGIWQVTGQVMANGSLGEVIRWMDSDYPYFIRPGARGARDHTAWQLTLPMGREAMALQLEDSVFPLSVEPTRLSLDRVDPLTGCIDSEPQKSAEDFYRRNYGPTIFANQDLQRLWLFKIATSLTQPEVDSLLAWDKFTPKLSPNVPAIGDPDELLTGEVAGARYVNGGEKPAIGRAIGEIDAKHLLTHIGEFPTVELEHRAERIHRKVRLDYILKLKSHDVDRLIVAAVNAEHRGGASASLWIRPATLSCLGLFLELITVHGCTAEECAGLVDVLSVYGQNGSSAFFDQVYSELLPNDDPLRIDGSPLAIIPVTAAEQHKVHQICTALRIKGETCRYLSTVIAEAKGKTTSLDCDLPTLSALWRLVRLARLSELTPIEYTALAQTLGLITQLAAEPVVSDSGSTEGADVLSAIDGLIQCSKWAKESNLSVLWLVQHVNPIVVPSVWSETQEQFLRQLASQTQPVLVQTATLLAAGAPVRFPHSEQIIDWMSLLGLLVDEYGLVIGEYDQTQEQYLAFAEEQCESVASVVYQDPADPTQEAKRDALKALLLLIVLRCRDEQRALVEENLAVYLQISSLLTRQILAWAQGHPHRFLSQALSMPEVPNRRVLKNTLEEPDQFLRLFAEVERRARIASKLNVSATLLEVILADENHQWFSLGDRYEISIQSFYYLSLFGRLVEQAREPEEKLLDYLIQVNVFDSELSEDARRLLRDAAADKLARFFGCGIKHVLTVVSHLKGEVQDSEQLPLLQNLQELDVLRRTLELSAKGLDAAAAVSLGNLSPLDTQAQYAKAAHNSLESYDRFINLKMQPESAEAGQSYTTLCTVDNRYLIANVDQEVAEFLLQLKDFFGVPLKGVPIQFKTDIGVMLTPEVRTDNQGRAVARLQAGKTMGAAHISYNLPLSDPIHGPTVTIGPDMESLRPEPELSSRLRSIPPLLAGRLEEVELFTVILDKYGNRPARFPLEWRTTLGEIRPRQTVTDKNGRSAVWVSSLSAGTAKYSVGPVDRSNTMTFADSLLFKDSPRIADVPFVTEVARMGATFLVRCKVVGLDGMPSDGKVVSWRTEPSTTTDEVATDKTGISRFAVLSSTSGALTIFARLGSDAEVRLTVEVIDTAEIVLFLANPPIAVVGARPTLLWVDVADKSGVDGKPVGLYPVEWKVHSVPPVTDTVLTDEQGRSVYPFEAAAAGTHTVTATLQHHPVQVQSFSVEAIRAFGWRVVLFTLAPNGDELNRETILPVPEGSGRLDLFRGTRYRIQIEASEPEQLDGSRGAVGWSSQYSTRALGMDFQPPMAESFTYGVAPHVIELMIGDVRNGDFEISVHADKLPQALVMPGTLRKRPLTPRPSNKA